MKKIITSVYLGNVLETYDFVLCGILISKLSSVFFPAEDPIFSVMLGLLAFGIGFLARPLGAIYFGHIGDSQGRKAGLSKSILGMSACTFAFCCLPGYETLGLFSSIAFLVLRIGQGFCMGGEGQGGSTFIIEHYWHNKPAFYGAVYATSNGMGALLATFISLLLTLPNVPAWCWRAAFLLGSLVGVAGFFLRRYLPETAQFKQIEQKKEILSTPLNWIMKNSKFNFFVVFAFVAAISATTYVGFAFVNVFLSSILHLDPALSLTYACIGTMMAMISVLIFGAIAVRFGTEKTIIFSSFLLLILALPIHCLLAKGDSVSILSALILLAIPTGGVCGPAPFFIASYFTTASRYSGAALSNNLAQGIFGGFQPFIAMYLIQKTGLNYSPAFYLIAVTLFFLVTFLIYYKYHSEKNSQRASYAIENH